jgi:hypothetical protein
MRHFLFYPTDAGEKNEPRWRDGRPLARLGASLLLSTAEVLLTGSRKIAHKSPLPLSRPRGGLKTATQALVK